LADDETWHVYSVGLGTKFPDSRIMNLGPWAVWCHHKLILVGK